MFATTDGTNNRHLHIFLLLENGIEREIGITPLLLDVEETLLTLPVLKYAERFTEKVEEEYRYEEREMSAVRLEVWRTRFDPQSLEPETSLLREFEIPTAPESVDRVHD